MPKKNNITFNDYLRIAKWSFKINWDMSPLITIIDFSTSLYRNLSGLINTYIIARVIDQIIAVVQSKQTDIRGVLVLVAILGVFKLLDVVVNNLYSYANRIRRKISSPYLSRLVYRKGFSLGVQTNQLPTVSNMKRVANEFIYDIGHLNRSVITIISSIIRVILSALIVFSFSLWIGILILLISVISYLQNKKYFRKDFEWQTSEKNLEGRRKTWRITGVFSNPDSMSEVSLVGAFKFLDSKYMNFHKYYNEGYKKIIKADTLTTFFVDLINIVAVLGGSVQVFVMAIQEKISIGNTTFYISSIDNFYSGVKNMTAELVYFTDAVMRGKEVLDFFDLEPVVKDGDAKLERLIIPPAIEVKNISFHYPNSKNKVFNNFSISIHSGEKVAIVGENGAGKSTLVKLLCRLYDPQQGKILINGVDLKELSINDWYKNVGVLFQDYNFYGSLSAEENIYIGKPVKKIDRRKVTKSARNAEAHDFIMKYRKKYKTIMSDDFKEGIRPSNGQRQKIAIARFFYRDAPLAIFDEPTSAIDANAEFRIFNRIYNFFNNKTVIIISHRFSTVRKADRIFVIKNGKIAEQGNHKELMARNGIYADNFNKQAQGYNSD